MAKGKSKKRKYSPTVKQRIAIKFMVENGGKASEAMRKAKYSEAMIHNPQRLTTSRAYIEILNKNGLDDETLSRTHRELLEATVLDQTSFPRKAGTSAQQDEKNIENIKKTIEHLAGHKLLWVTIQKDRYKDEYIAHFRRPESTSKQNGLAMAYKVKGHFAPIKVDAPPGGYNLDQKDKEKLDDIFNGD